MVNRVQIVPACLRDVTYIIAYLRQSDAEEVFCQLPEGTTGFEVALTLLATDAYVALLDGQPVMAFGTHPLTVAASAAWAIGTDKTPRVVAAVTRYFVEVIGPRLVSDGHETLEARSLLSHSAAHRWMRASGAEVAGPPFIYGRDRKKFLLFRWTADAFRVISAMRASSQGACTAGAGDCLPVSPRPPTPATGD